MKRMLLVSALLCVVAQSYAAVGRKPVHPAECRTAQGKLAKARNAYDSAREDAINKLVPHEFNALQEAQDAAESACVMGVFSYGGTTL